MSGVITEADRDFVRNLIERGTFKKIKNGDFERITKNGGVAIFCGDGDIDVYNYHSRMVSRRPHSFMAFGGPLVFSSDFGGYSKSFAEGALENIGIGSGAKETHSAFLYPHFPCGAALKFGLNIQGVIFLSAQAHRLFSGLPFFAPEKVHSFFHIKRMNKGNELEQNTYIFYPELI